MLSRCLVRRVAVLALPLAAVLAPDARADSVLDRYDAALTAYRDGRYAEAVGAAAAFTDRDLDALRVYWFERTGDSAPRANDESPRRLRLAAMLHLEAAFTTYQERLNTHDAPTPAAADWLDDARLASRFRPSGAHATHLSIGLGLVALVESPRSPPESFRRRWYLAAAMHFHSHAQTFTAHRVLATALESFPDDGPLLLESGALAESEATAGAPAAYTRMMEGLVRAQAERKAALAFAEKHLRLVFAADDTLVEARVRLGRVLTEANRPDEAARELEGALAQSPRPYLVYLAQLFLGDVHQRADRLDEAIACYRAAIDAYPLGQAARTALAHALHRQGDHDAAFEAVRASLALEFEGGQADPWWAYGLSQLRPFDALLESLREEARQ